jgi:hypothetical protein
MGEVGILYKLNLFILAKKFSVIAFEYLSHIVEGFWCFHCGYSTLEQTQIL